MRTCPNVWGITAHCERLCPRNGEATAGLTELTITTVIICIGMRTLLTRALLYKKKHQRTQINGFKFSYIRQIWKIQWL